MKVSDSAPTLPPTLALPPTEAFLGELVFRGEEEIRAPLKTPAWEANASVVAQILH